MPPPNLNALPTELIEFIAENLTRNELADLRSVCRELLTKSEKVFLRVCFSTLSVMLSDGKSLRNALRLTRRKRYREAIRKVVFFLDEVTFNKRYFHTLVEVDEDYDNDNNDESLVTDGKFIHELHVETVYGISKRTRKEILPKQEELRKSGTDTTLLDMLLARLKKTKKLESISFMDQGTLSLLQNDTLEVRWPYGDSLHQTSCGVPVPGQKTSFFKIVRALSENAIRPTSLSMDLLAWSLSLDNITRHERQSLSGVLRGVKSLILQTHASNFPRDPDSLGHFCALLSSLPALEELTINNHWPDEHGRAYQTFEIFLDFETLPAELFVQKYEVLKKLTLRGMALRLSQLVDFLQKNPTIEVLALDRIEDLEGWYGQSLEDAQERFRSAVLARELSVEMLWVGLIV